MTFSFPLSLLMFRVAQLSYDSRSIYSFFLEVVLFLYFLSVFTIDAFLSDSGTIVLVLLPDELNGMR